MYLTPWSRLLHERLARSRRKRRRRVPRSPGRIEQLEDRTLLSTASFVDGVFAFTSDAGVTNNVIVLEADGLVKIRDTASSITPTGSVQQGLDANEVTFDQAQVTKVELNLDDGDDTVNAEGLTISLLVNAGDGADSVTGGEAADTLNGNNDGDSLVGAGGRSTTTASLARTSRTSPLSVPSLTSMDCATMRAPSVVPAWPNSSTCAPPTSSMWSGFPTS